MHEHRPARHVHLTIAAIDPAVADELRATGGRVYVADSRPGYPCRHCLRDEAVGDELEPTPAIPEQLTCCALSVRAFDQSAMMLDAAVIDGGELDATIARLLTDPAVDHLHVHNASRGCFAARVDRIGATASV